jgi:tetratricopeptide (TPR) repeat protein/class 3 adenylate cyclase/predicted ATPase
MPAKQPLPSGRVTIVFTDIENSALMTNDMGNAAYLQQLRDPHQKVLMAAFARYHGVAVDTAGDSFMAVFQHAKDALACVVAIQNQLAAEPLRAAGRTREWTVVVRIGVHTAERDVVPNRLRWIPNARLAAGNVEYSGTDTNFAARIGGMGVGGQIIVSNSTYAAAENKNQHRWQAWPNRRLKSFETAPETVWELLYDGQTRGEPGRRWVPDWYRGELNRYIARPELQDMVIDHFKNTRDSVRMRLVTLHSEGGMGKSRLAIACAVAMVGLFQNGVYFVDLAHDEADDSARTREAVAQAIGLTLGFSGQALEPDRLLTALRSSERLLVLDNYESVDCREVRLFIRDLVVRTNSLCLLVTSRVPVDLPDVEQIVPMNDGMTLEQARSLFLAYAGLRGRTQAIDGEEERDLQRVLSLTERIPLAIELAAAWAGSRAIGEIANGLEKTPLGRMSQAPADTDRADASPHHYSLTRSLDWSYGLLSDEVKHGFAPLGLFADSFGVEAVADMLAGTADEAEDVVDTLHRACLVRRAESGRVSRYSMHRFTREYARRKLADPIVATAMRRRFVAHYSKLVDGNCNLNDPAHRAELGGEWQNVLAAVSAAEASGDWASVITLSNVGQFLNLRGLWPQLDALHIGELAAARKLADRNAEGAVLVRMGGRYSRLCQWVSAQQACTDALDIFRELGNRKGEAKALFNLAVTYTDQGRREQAEHAYDDALAISRQSGERLVEGWTLRGLGDICEGRGDSDRAETMLAESLAIARELGNLSDEAHGLRRLGWVFYGRGAWKRAQKVFEQSLAISRELGDRRAEALGLVNLGDAHGRQGNWDETKKLNEQSLAILRTIGDRSAEAVALVNLGDAYCRQGKLDEAEKLIEMGLAIAREIGDRTLEPEALVNLGDVCLRRGESASAEHAFQQGLAIFKELEDPRGQGTALRLLASVHQGRREWDKAESAYRSSIDILRNVGERPDLADALLNMADMMKAQGKLSEALPYAREALDISEQTEDQAKLSKARALLKEMGA